MLAKEIHDRKIPGDVAEFGVYRGDFAKFINELFPDRTLHLFDTFEIQTAEESAEYTGLFKDANPNIDSTIFLDTSVDLVMSKMKFPDKVKIYKGFFPNTVPTEEKIFSFVSIDIGTYQTAIDGLRYFYPRLSAGGFIMLKCYNLEEVLGETAKGIDDFEKEFGKISKVPIPDLAGTLVITK